MANRVKCIRCDRHILEQTARKTHGLCAICERDQKRAEFDAIVKGWIDNPEMLPGTHGIPEPESLAFRIAASQLKSRLYPTADDIMENECHDFFDKAYGKWMELGSSGLSAKEKYALAVETFYGEVTNGGLRQYLDNSSGAFAEWAADGFEAIGIPVYANVMRKVKSLFPQGIIPEIPDSRWNQAVAIDDESLEAIERAFWDRYHTDANEIRRKLFQYLNT